MRLVRLILILFIFVTVLQVEYEEFNSLSVLGTYGDPHIIPLPDAKLPLQVLHGNFIHQQKIKYMYLHYSQ